MRMKRERCNVRCFSFALLIVSVEVNDSGQLAAILDVVDCVRARGRWRLNEDERETFYVLDTVNWVLSLHSIEYMILHHWSHSVESKRNALI